MRLGYSAIRVLEGTFISESMRKWLLGVVDLWRY